MKGLAQGGLFLNRGSLKIHGVVAWSTGSVVLLRSQESQGCTRAGPCTESLVSHSGVSRKQSLVSRMAMRSGSVRLPGERAASRPNNLLGWELSTAVRDTRSRVPYPGLHS